MNRILYVFVVGVITCTLVAGLNVEGKTATPDGATQESINDGGV